MINYIYGGESAPVKEQHCVPHDLGDPGMFTDGLSLICEPYNSLDYRLILMYKNTQNSIFQTNDF